MTVNINDFNPYALFGESGFGGRVYKELCLISEQEASKETKMLGKFAVVKDTPYARRMERPFEFYKLYDTPESARDEAIRLSRRDKCGFFIIQIIGEAVMVDVEMTWDSSFEKNNEIIPF